MTILAWAWYGLAVAALLAFAAVACDAIARILARPTRWVWLTSIVASIAAPILGLVVRAGAPPRTVRPLCRSLVPCPPISIDGLFSHGRPYGGFAAAPTPGATWRAAELGRVVRGDGARSPGAGRRGDGPAVVGAIHPVIVVPEWVLGLPRSQRALVVLHEVEHRRAGDQWLELAASVIQAILPWNVALWYQVERLRLAVELDCDARVLRQRPDVGRYGRLLVDCAGAHHVRGTVRVARPALGGPHTLAHPIRAMTAPRPTLWIGCVRASAYAAAACLAVGTTTSVRRPPPVQWTIGERTSPAQTPLVSLQEGDDRIVAVDAQGIVKQVSGPPLRQGDAAALRHVRGPALVRFTPDPDRPTQTVAIVTYRQGA